METVGEGIDLWSGECLRYFMSKWLIVDGYNLMFRCFYAIPHLSRADGFPTNAIHGWLRSLWKLADGEKPDELLVVFDLGDDPEKLALLPGYKADRAEMPDTLKPQVPVIKELTRKLGSDMVEIAEVEADDIIGSYAASLANEGHEVYIVSADKDLAQCVRDGVKMMIPPPTANAKVGWQRLDAAGVKEKFGVEPDQIPDYLALIGDTIDCIPGIAGVGPKTAAKWLQEFGSLEGILAHVNEIKPERFREKLESSRELLARNLRLTTLNCQIALPPFQKYPPDPDGLYKLLEDLEMKGHLKEARKRYGEPDLFSGLEG
jgi:DNA polymerase I